jgi:hypothetical protein
VLDRDGQRDHEARTGITRRQKSSEEKDRLAVANDTRVLAAADVFTPSTTFWVMESVRLDKGVGSQVHPRAFPKLRPTLPRSGIFVPDAGDPELC